MYTILILPLEKDGCEINENVIVIGRVDDNKNVQKYVKEHEIPENGYVVKVFYGAVDYIDNYLPCAAKNISNEIYSEYNTFDDKTPDYFNASYPKT